MAGAALAIDVEWEDRRVKEALRRLVAAGGNMQTVFADIGEYLLISHHERFDKEETPDGTPWEPLKEETLRRKMLRGKRGGAAGIKAASKILRESGDMADTLRYQADDRGLDFGTDRIQGATHQLGDEDRGIPAREFLGLSDEDERQVLVIIHRHIEAAMAG